MKCEICNESDSVIHVQQVMGDETVELHLCDTCAQDRGISRVDDKIELSLSQLLTGLVGSGAAKAEQKTKGSGHSVPASPRLPVTPSISLERRRYSSKPLRMEKVQ